MIKYVVKSMKNKFVSDEGGHCPLAKAQLFNTKKEAQKVVCSEYKEEIVKIEYIPGIRKVIK